MKQSLRVVYEGAALDVEIDVDPDTGEWSEWQISADGETDITQLIEHVSRRMAHALDELTEAIEQSRKGG